MSSAHAHDTNHFCVASRPSPLLSFLITTAAALPSAAHLPSRPTIDTCSVDTSAHTLLTRRSTVRNSSATVSDQIDFTVQDTRFEVTFSPLSHDRLISAPTISHLPHQVPGNMTATLTTLSTSFSKLTRWLTPTPPTSPPLLHYKLASDDAYGPDGSARNYCPNCGVYWPNDEVSAHGLRLPCRQPHTQPILSTGACSVANAEAALCIWLGRCTHCAT